MFTPAAEYMASDFRAIDNEGRVASKLKCMDFELTPSLT